MPPNLQEAPPVTVEKGPQEIFEMARRASRGAEVHQLRVQKGPQD